MPASHFCADKLLLERDRVMDQKKIALRKIVERCDESSLAAAACLEELMNGA